MLKLSRIAFACCMMALPFTLASCGAAAGTPEQAAQSFFNALSDADYGVAYELLTAEQKSQMQEELKAIAGDEKSEALRRLNLQFGTNFSSSGLASMSADEFFAKAMASARTSDPEFQAMLSKPPQVVDSRIEDDAGEVASVQVRFAGEGKSTGKRLQTFRFVLDGRDWRAQFSR